MPKNDYDNNYFDAVFKSIFEDLKQLTSRMDKADDDHVTQREFTPVKNIVYGLVGLMLTAVVAALLGLVLKN
jgi:hypothetical protein